MTWLPRRDDVVNALTRSLEGVAGVDLCVLYGSYARGTAVAGSDIDVLVVADDAAMGARVRQHVCHDAPELAQLLSVATVRVQSLVAEQRSRPSFVTHLRDEGDVLGPRREMGGSSVLGIIQTPVAREAFDAEVHRRLERAWCTSRVERLNGVTESALGRMYATAKAICITRLVGAGRPEYDWRRVFDAFGDAWPEAADQAWFLSGLRPYYEQLRGVLRAEVPALDRSEALATAKRCLKDLVIASRD